MKAALLVLAACLLAGCAADSSGTWAAEGAVAGAAAGAAAGRGSVVASSAGALAGGALGALAASSQRRSSLRAFDDGYLLGSSDAVKRLYWARQTAERPKGQDEGMTLLRRMLQAADAKEGEGAR